jgi:hypothetical protein
MISIALALSVGAADGAVDLSQWNERRLRTTRVGMLVLGGFAVGNIAVGAVGFALERDEQLRWLHLGNASWNAVNLGLAIAGLWADWNSDPSKFTAKESLEASSTQEKILLLNAGLDVAYLAMGAFLWQRGFGTADPRMVGFGQALLIQGGFLLVFDTVLAILNGRLTNELMMGVDVTPTSTSARLGWRW